MPTKHVGYIAGLMRRETQHYEKNAISEVMKKLRELGF